MSDRIAHDHPTIETIEATLGRYGGTHQPKVTIDATLDIEPDSVIRLVFDSSEYFARFEHIRDGRWALRHAARSPRLARFPGEAPNTLAEWIEDIDTVTGHALLVDIVEPGFKYGLRQPGSPAVYSTGRPDDSLADIANNIDSRP